MSQSLSFRVKSTKLTSALILNKIYTFIFVQSNSFVFSNFNHFQNRGSILLCFGLTILPENTLQKSISCIVFACYLVQSIPQRCDGDNLSLVLRDASHSRSWRSVVCVVSSVVLYLTLNYVLLFIEESKCLHYEYEFNLFSLMETRKVKQCSICLRRHDSINILQEKFKLKQKVTSKRLNYYPNSVKTFRLICICGGVELNPGPTKQSKQRDGYETRGRWKYPWVECGKPVKKNQEGILCAVPMPLAPDGFMLSVQEYQKKCFNYTI